MWTYRAKLARVVDGDTVDLEVDLGFYILACVRVRLEGVDTPERGQDGWREATQFVEDWFEGIGGECVVITSKTGKYGRWLATIYVNTLMTNSLNHELVETGHAVPYGS